MLDKDGVKNFQNFRKGAFEKKEGINAKMPP